MPASTAASAAGATAAHAAMPDQARVYAQARAETVRIRHDAGGVLRMTRSVRGHQARPHEDAAEQNGGSVRAAPDEV